MEEQSPLLPVTQKQAMIYDETVRNIVRAYNSKFIGSFK
jgi:hypothetical protein